MTRHVGVHVVSQFCIWTVPLAVLLAMLMTTTSCTVDCDTGHATDGGSGNATGCAGKYPDCKLFQLSSIYVWQ